MKNNTDQPEGACDLGVVLFWIDRRLFGRYGYLAAYPGPAKPAVIYFDEGSLSGSTEPTEGSLVHYDIQGEEDLDGRIRWDGRIKAVNVEAERFTAHLPQLDFKESDFRVFPVLEPSDPLGNHLLTGLSPELKRTLEQYYEIDRAICTPITPEVMQSLEAYKLEYRLETYGEIPQELMNYVNTVIGGPSLIRLVGKERFAKVKFRKITSLLLKRNPQGRDLTWLNRLLLGDAFPVSFDPKPEGVDCSDQIYQASVVKRDGRSRLGGLEPLKGGYWPFSFSDFPSDDLVPHTGDPVQCRMHNDGVYDIWPIPSQANGAADSVVDRLRKTADDATQKLDAASSRIGDKTALLQAATEEAKEAFEPLHEFYKDPRLSNARTDAKRAGIPELFVDTVAARIDLGEKFPTTDILYKYLSNPILAKKLKAGGHGISRSTIGRWLTRFKIILHRRGFPITKYRARNTNPQNKPAKSTWSSIGGSEKTPDGDDLPQEEVTGRTNRDTRAQELGEDTA